MVSPLTEGERVRLIRDFHRHLLEDCHKCDEIGYSPKRFREMLSKDGPIKSCEAVILKNAIPDGFITLLEKERLDLTAEASVLRSPWCGLWRENKIVLERARKRLSDYAYADLSCAALDC